MSSKPTSFIDWCPDGDPGKVIQPSTALAHAGYVSGQVPVAQHHNWLLYTLDQWIRWLDEASELNLVQGTFNGARPLSVRMVGGGTWGYVASTGVLSWSAAWNLSIPGIPLAANNVPASSATLADGQCAYVTANLPFNTTGNLHSGGPDITNVGNVLGIQTGMVVYGTGVPTGTTVSAVSGSTVTMSANATGDSTGAALTFAFSGNLAVAVAVEQDIDASDGRKVVFARRSGAQVFMGVPGNSMMLQDTQQKALLADPNTIVVAAGETVTAGQVVYISPGASDGGRTAGAAYKADASATNGAARGNPAGIATHNASATDPLIVATAGIVRLFSGLTPGTKYYLSASVPGAVSSNPPSGNGQYVALVGPALSSTAMAVALETRAKIFAPVTSETYFTHFANAIFATDPAIITATSWSVFAGNPGGYVRVKVSGGTQTALVPLHLPGSGTIVGGTFDVAAEGGSDPAVTTVGLVRLSSVDEPSTIFGGLLSGGPYAAPTTVGVVPNTYSRFSFGTLSEAISPGNSYCAYVQWNPTGNAVVRWVGFRMQVNTAYPHVTAG